MFNKVFFLFLALILVSSCSNHWRQKRQAYQQNYYYEDEADRYDDFDEHYHQNRDESFYRAERDSYVDRPYQGHSHMERPYYDDTSNETQDYYGEDSKGQYRKPQDRCIFYGFSPGSAAYRDCHKKLNMQSKQKYRYNR